MHLVVDKRTIFRRERFDVLLVEAMPLIAANFDEMKQCNSDALALMTNLYNKLEDIDALRLYTVRTDNGILIGYRSLALTRHQHTGKLVARCDALYVTPSERGLLGSQLLDWSDQELANEGITEVYQAHKPEIRDLSALFSRHGYEQVEVLYSRKLTKE